MTLRLGLLHCDWRRSLFLLAAAGLVALCAAIGALQSIHEESQWQITAFFLLLPIGLAVTFSWPRTGTPGVQAAGVLLLALVARLALFPHPVDSDVYRYLWEGRLVREGYDPYARIASAPEWTGLQDAYWQGMNQKDLHTIYPPVTQWIFSAAGGVWYHPMALKAMFVAFDLGSIVLLLAMLSSRSQPLWFAGRPSGACGPERPAASRRRRGWPAVRRWYSKPLHHRVPQRSQVRAFRFVVR